MITPLHSFFVIETESVTKSASGLIMAATKLKAKAKVLAVPKNEEDVKVGDTILIDKGMPYTIEVDGQQYTVISKDDVFGIL